MNESSTMRVFELYSGIGGMHSALRESGVKGEVVAAVDINTVANDVYRHNFPDVHLMNRNIQSITLDEINKLNIDTILMSPPCQPFTRVGLKKDSLDNRASSLFYVLKLIPQIETLKHILVENVKGFESSDTRDSLVQCIEAAGFQYTELILSPCQFGIPNTRTRYYLLAKKKGLHFCFNESKLQFDIPTEVLSLLPKSRHQILAQETDTQSCKNGKICYTIDKVLEQEDLVDYLIPRELLQKRAWVLDIRNPKSNGSCCFTKAYGHYLEGTGSVYCPFSEETIKQTFAEAVEKDIHSIEALNMLEQLKLRFFTPQEVCRLMCFPDNFTFPKHITNKQKYRLLGNSINVHVVSKLIYLLQL